MPDCPVPEMEEVIDEVADMEELDEIAFHPVEEVGIGEKVAC